MTFIDRLNNAPVRYLLFWVCLGLVAWVSLLPKITVETDIPKAVQAYDIPFHFFIYFVLASTAILAMGRQDSQMRDRISFFLLCGLFGAVLEILQATAPGINRTCTVSDFLSNTSGAACAAAVFPIKMLLTRTPKISTLS